MVSGKRSLVTRDKPVDIRIDGHGDTEKAKVELSLTF